MNDVVGRLCAAEDAPKVGDVEGVGVTEAGAVGLIGRLERATGPDRELDLALANLSIDDGKPWYFLDASREMVTRRKYGQGARGNPVCGLERFTNYTEDAAVLVESGLDWAVHSTADGCFATVLTPDAVEHEGVGNTTALALCIAALKARTSHSQDTPDSTVTRK